MGIINPSKLIVFCSLGYSNLDIYTMIQLSGYEVLTNIHYPVSFAEDTVNLYSIVHFVEYGVLSFIKQARLLHVLCISTVWEIIELFVVSEWARESWGNKIMDIVFNILGFYSFRKVFQQKNI